MSCVRQRLGEAPPLALIRQAALLRHPAPRTGSPGWRATLELSGTHKGPAKRKRPHLAAEPSSIELKRSYLLPEAVHQSALDAQIVLLGSAEVRIQILDLNRAKRQVTRDLEVSAAAKRHRKCIRRC